MLMVFVGSLFRCVVKNMCKEYVAVNSVPAPVIIIVKFDQLNVDVIIKSSPIKLIVGGRAMFIKLASSHHVVISGKMSCRPRARSIVRLCVRS